jgi:hypothetical protein
MGRILNTDGSNTEHPRIKLERSATAVEQLLSNMGPENQIISIF